MNADFTRVIDEVCRNLENHAGESCRLFHGRGNCFAGLEHLNIDYHPPVLWIQCYRETNVTELADGLRRTLVEKFGLPLTCVLLQQRYLPKSPWLLLAGCLPANCEARERGLSFELRFLKNQNVGFFPDMRHGRDLVRRLAPGKRVLNLFAYTCSFSVVAIAAGARFVLNLDINKAVLRTGKRNHERNGLDCRKAHFLPYDVLKSFGQIRKKGPFGLIVIDPPTMQRGAFKVERDYPKIARRLPTLLEPGDHVVACLNAPHIDERFLLDLFCDFEPLEQLGRPSDFPERDEHKSLKVIHFCRVK